MPWSVLVQIVEPHDPKAKTGRPPFAIATMLRIHSLQQWFGLSLQLQAALAGTTLSGKSDDVPANTCWRSMQRVARRC